MLFAVQRNPPIPGAAGGGGGGGEGSAGMRTESWVGEAVALTLVQTGKGRMIAPVPLLAVGKQGSFKNRRGSLWGNAA